VCVAIPCAPAHWTLLPRALRSVALQTRQADAVVVLMSHVAEVASCGQRQEQIRRWHPGAILSCVASANMPGANRNRAVEACGRLGMTHVAFVDADDEMYPVRLERMLGLMAHFNASLGLHNYKVVAMTCAPTVGMFAELVRGAPDESGGRLATTPARQPRLRRPRDMRAAIGPAHPGRDRPLRFPTHHGQVVVRLSTLAAVPQPPHQREGEDVAFIHAVIRAGYHAVHTNERLVVYHWGSTVGVPDAGSRPLPMWTRHWDWERAAWHSNESWTMRGVGRAHGAPTERACFEHRRGCDLALQDERIALDEALRCQQRFLDLDMAKSACLANRNWCSGIIADNGLKCHRQGGGKFRFELRGGRACLETGMGSCQARPDRLTHSHLLGVEASDGTCKSSVSGGHPGVLQTRVRSNTQPQSRADEQPLKGSKTLPRSRAFGKGDRRSAPGDARPANARRSSRLPERMELRDAGHEADGVQENLQRLVRENEVLKRRIHHLETNLTRALRINHVLTGNMLLAAV